FSYFIFLHHFFVGIVLILSSTMKHLLPFSIIFLSLISCAKKNDDTIVNPITPVGTIHKSYLALGDSYTIGESVAETERFPVQTVQLLRAQNIDISNPDIIAVTGWTTGNLINALKDNSTKTNYSVVSILIGVNNQYQGRSLDEYKTEFATLLTKAISYAGNNKGHVFVLSIPDYSVTPFASGSYMIKVAQEIDDFNAANKNISLNAGVHYLDITPTSRDAKRDPSLTAVDGLHPSGIQYKKWSDLLAPLMLKELQQVR
ncbi:MAG: SGNH/GDSL hydrolase family protein, partial [Ginsengibacter sp.]